MVGKLLVSTVFTIILVPVVYSMFLSLRIRLMRTLGREGRGQPVPAPAAASSRATLETAARSAEPVPVASDD